MSDEKVNRRVLIASDQTEELRTVRELLQYDKSELFGADNVETGLRLFQEHLPALLVLSFQDLEKAERFYLMLHRQCPTIKEIPHQTLLLCKGTESEGAFALCRSGTLDDYIVNRPLHDPFRLRLAVLHALNRKAMRSQSVAVTRQLSQIGTDLRHLDTFINKAMTSGQGHHADSLIAFREFVSRLTKELDQFEVRLEDSNREPSSALIEQNGLRKQIDHLRQEVVEPHARKIDGKLEETHVWLQRLGDDYREHAAQLNEHEYPAEQPEVLLVDDDDVYREMLGAILEEVSVRVSMVSSGELALAEMHRRQPAMVLLDYNMPGLDGMSVLKEMKRDPDLQHIPVVMLSGMKDSDSVKEAISAGAAGYIVKPSNRPTILAKIQSLLAKPK